MLSLVGVTTGGSSSLAWIALTIAGALYRVGDDRAELTHALRDARQPGLRQPTCRCCEDLRHRRQRAADDRRAAPAGRRDDAHRRRPSRRGTHVRSGRTRPATVAVADYANTHNPTLISHDGRTTWASDRHAQSRPAESAAGVMDRIRRRCARRRRGRDGRRDRLRAALSDRRWRGRAERAGRDADRRGRRARRARVRVRVGDRDRAAADGGRRRS